MKRTILTAVLTAVFGITDGAFAQEAAPNRDFTFRRVKVGEPKTGSRITVQIDPDEQRAYITPPRPVTREYDADSEIGPQPEAQSPSLLPDMPEIKTSDVFAWYWAKVSPSLSAGSSGRLEEAVQSLNGGPDGQMVATPRLQDMQNIAAAYGIDILKATIGTKVSPAFVLAVIGIESSGDSTALSHAGAQGLMQLIPATAERFGVTDSTDPVQNIKGGVAYLDWLMSKFGNDPVLVLAAYNAGENAVLRNEGVPPYDETRAYVPKVLAAWTVARGLCLTPPQLISDGCVFAVKEAKNDG